MYIIKRTDQKGGYLNQPGSKNAYTQDITKARTFSTEEAAQAECCPMNETPINLDDILVYRFNRQN